jgi:hypothetical protein
MRIAALAPALAFGLAAGVVAPPALAHPAVDVFARCIADHTTGKDRKDLARWMFTAMGAHAEMRAVAPIPPAASEEATRTAGQLFMRLLTEACAGPGRAAVQAVGPGAIQSAFTVFGQLAMQELMTDKDVAAAMSRLEQSLDRAKLDATYAPR